MRMQCARTSPELRALLAFCMYIVQETVTERVRRTRTRHNTQLGDCFFARGERDYRAYPFHRRLETERQNTHTYTENKHRLTHKVEKHAQVEKQDHSLV